MSLQTRLFAFFIAIVVFPLAVASVLSQRIIVRELEERSRQSLRMANQAAVVVYEERLSSARDRVQLIATDPQFGRLLVEGRYAELEPLMARKLAESAPLLDFLVATDAGGSAVAAQLSMAEFLRGVDPLTPQEIVSPSGPRRLMLAPTVVPIQAGQPPSTVASLHGGFFLDGGLVRRMAEATGAGVTVVVGGESVATSLAGEGEVRRPAPVTIPTSETYFEADLYGRSMFAVAVPLARGVPVGEGALLISAEGGPASGLSRFVTLSMVLLLILALAGSAVLGFLLARTIARPMRELAAGANAIAAGNYDQHIKVRSEDEIGQLARAFNEMAERLAIHIAELRENREELKRALTRFGETLRATHDLKKMLHVVLETSMDTLRAQRGMLMLMTPARDGLVVSVARGLDAHGVEVRMGEGIAGYVAAGGNAVRLPNGDGVTPAPQEPGFRTALAVPIFSQQRVIAVLNIYDKQEGLNFTEADLGTLLSLADQAGVAIENVLLHQEAERLSITDGLTGLWNYRFFRMRYEQEIDRSARFKRPFSLLVFDIDSFKNINDTHGHQQGDSILVELARRAKSVIREIDILARYGGEEFVLILPETDAEGALRTAERIRAVVAGAAFGEDDPIPVTVSAGVACFPTHGSDGATLLRASDMAMYRAKALGKNRVVLYRPPEAASAGG